MKNLKILWNNEFEFEETQDDSSSFEKKLQHRVQNQK